MEFSPAGDLQNAGFLDRLRVLGFRLLPAVDAVTEANGLRNFYGSIGDGSRWMICANSEGLIRHDVTPWQFFKLDGTKLVSSDGFKLSKGTIDGIAKAV